MNKGKLQGGAADDNAIEFISRVAHDLRSPMTSIVGFIDGILDGAISEEDVPKYLRIVKDECMRLSGLVEQMLELARLDSGRADIELAPFDICERARKALLTFERRIEEKELAVSFRSDGHNMLALGDHAAIHRVLYNLIDNAVKYARHGGELTIKIEKSGENIRVAVFNEGEGIPPSEIGHIFDMYYQADREKNRGKVSAGIGLNLCKLIIDAHGGNIAAESKYGESCEISFTLKAASKEK